MKKVCYGLAIPGIVMTLCLYCHVSIGVANLSSAPLIPRSQPRPSLFAYYETRLT
jgi:hypothetical protein